MSMVDYLSNASLRELVDAGAFCPHDPALYKVFMMISPSCIKVELSC